MTDFLQLFTIVGGLLALVLLGAALKAVQIVPAAVGPALNSLVINLTLPATVFLAVRDARAKTANFDLAVLRVALIAFLVIAISAGLAWLASRYWLHLAPRTEGSFLIVTMFGSTASVALPIILRLYPAANSGSGPNQLAALFYSEIGTLIPLVTAGVLIASVYGEAEAGKQFGWRTLLAIPRSAPFIALAIGLLFYTDDIPSFITDFLALLRSANAPLVFLALGIIIVPRDLNRWWRSLLAVNAIKLIAAPLLALLFARMLGLPGDMVKVSIIEAAVPAVLLGIAYANQYKLDVEFASTAVFSSFLFSIITLPLMVALLGGLDSAERCVDSGKKKVESRK